MNEVFNLKRFGLLFREQISKNLKLFLMGSIVVFAILFALNLITILSISNHLSNENTRFGYYLTLMFPAGILLSGFWFSNLHKSSIETGGLLLPASHFEKICIAFIINVIVFIIMYILIVLSLELILFQEIKILRIIIKHGLRYGSALNEFYMPFLALQSVFLFGSLVFKKSAPIKTGFSLFIIFLILQFIHLIVFKIHFRNQNLYDYGDFLGGNSDIVPSYFFHTFTKVVYYCSFPVFWIASYYKLKEKQV
jgi:hypothetical protein